MSQFVRVIVFPIMTTGFAWIGWSLNYWQVLAVMTVALTFYAVADDSGKLSGRLK